MPPSQSERAQNLRALLANCSQEGRLYYKLAEPEPGALPRYASVVGCEGDAPIDAPNPVVLHETPERPVPVTTPWMACFDLDSGMRL